ncbi:glycoside hydrolase family 16 protein [Macrolepiota fuliginosa MF-IS2]|uniref:Glycoside hydrolase family 16 protein n=1 Tax=Macrolepiota fuliginosa MF-IS2 TaxID=1400762 RepID=A0A9P5XNZ4_9AGAR|nr:glycoside hydrolase family 16 protein [Macrolepiota fuliginosa MF-IS2]
MRFQFALLFSLILGVLSRGDLRRSPSRLARVSRQHRQAVRRFVAHQDGLVGDGGQATKPSVNTRDPGGTFRKDVVYKGEDFFSQWKFFSNEDPTHGLVNYQNQGDASSKHLAYVDRGVAVLAVDDTTVLQPGQKRDSVRITSTRTFNGGLFIADFAQMPSGCSLWPAYWSVGPNWPSGGEIDILEGVHNQATNQYTLHTTGGCTASHGSLQITGQPGQTTQCATIGSDNTGCAYHDTDSRSYGSGFNSAGGGVFAHLWDRTGIKAWRFARNDIPQDIQSENPNPAGWGTPVAYWSADTCDMVHFSSHSLVIDTTLCGDWAGATYTSAGCPGTCQQAVADPNNFKNAKWRINYIGVYQST